MTRGPEFVLLGVAHLSTLAVIAVTRDLADTSLASASLVDIAGETGLLFRSADTGRVGLGAARSVSVDQAALQDCLALERDVYLTKQRYQYLMEAKYLELAKLDYISGDMRNDFAKIAPERSYRTPKGKTQGGQPGNASRVPQTS